MTHRLFNSVKRDWPQFDGMCASRGFDPFDLPWDRFLNLAFWFLTEGADAESLEDFNRKLWMPLDVHDEVPAGSPWSVEAQEAAMAAFGTEFQSIGSVEVE